MSEQPSLRYHLGSYVRVTAMVFMGLVLVGTIAFKLAGGEEWSLFDALYMTVITITTVGFEEVHRLDPAGRLVAILLIFLGVGAVIYLSGSAAEAIIAGRLMWRRRVERAIRKLQGHYIICGRGRMGRAIAAEFRHRNTPYVVVDAAEPPLDTDELVVVGDATDDETLIRAGIERAAGLVTVLGSDPDNVYVVVTARSLRPDLFIVARASDDKAARNLERAGAQRVLNPYERGGVIMAQVLLRPRVVDFLEEVSLGAGLDLQMEQFEVRAGSSLAGKKLRDTDLRARLNVIVTAILRGGDVKIFNPSPDEEIHPGDILIGMGRPEALDELSRLVRGESRAAGA